MGAAKIVRRLEAFSEERQIFTDDGYVTDGTKHMDVEFVAYNGDILVIRQAFDLSDNSPYGFVYGWKISLTFKMKDEASGALVSALRVLQLPKEAQTEHLKQFLRGRLRGNLVFM